VEARLIFAGGLKQVVRDNSEIKIHMEGCGAGFKRFYV